MDSTSYCQVLQRYLAEKNEIVLEEDWILRQDDSSVHASNRFKQWLEAFDTDVLEWSARSPDLKIIENAQGLLERKFYRIGRQYDDVFSLQGVIMLEWNKVSTE